VEVTIPKLRTGSYLLDWLLTHRRRAEQALVSVVATSYLLGVSTRRVEKLVEQLGVASLSRARRAGRSLQSPLSPIRRPCP
jgi:putative transposase